jgi:hypothetical protein
MHPTLPNDIRKSRNAVLNGIGMVFNGIGVVFNGIGMAFNGIGVVFNGIGMALNVIGGVFNGVGDVLRGFAALWIDPKVASIPPPPYSVSAVCPVNYHSI